MPKYSKKTIRFWLFQALIVLIPFSYLPRIYLSKSSGLNLEFSLVQIAAIIFVLFSLDSIWRHREYLWSILPLKLLTLFVMFNGLSILWAEDKTRSLILWFFWCLLLALVLSIVALFKSQKIKQRDITNPLLIGAIVGSIFGFWQVIAEMLNISTSYSHLLKNYTDLVFGVARIQSFALEPQFYASTLIAPILYLTWRLLFGKFRKYHTWMLIWFVIIFLLTISRGAISGMAVSLLAMIGYGAYTNMNLKFAKKLLKIVGIYSAAFGVCLIVLFIAGSSTENHTGLSSIESYIDHMSHGVIDLKIASGGAGVDGLVEESTTGRFYMVGLALDLLAVSDLNYLFGIGIGSFGPMFNQVVPGATRLDHVINNQYVEYLTELGVIGLGLFTMFIGSLFNYFWRRASKYSILLSAVFVSYLLQYLFFSLQTNVVHVWIFVGVAIGVMSLKTNKKLQKKK